MRHTSHPVTVWVSVMSVIVMFGQMRNFSWRMGSFSAVRGVPYTYHVKNTPKWCKTHPQISIMDARGYPLSSEMSRNGQLFMMNAQFFTGNIDSNSYRNRVRRHTSWLTALFTEPWSCEPARCSGECSSQGSFTPMGIFRNNTKQTVKLRSPWLCE